MNRRIVLAVDADISPQTQHMLRVASSLLELSVPHLGVVLLHVIPVPDMTPSKFGMSIVAPTAEQRELAEHALHRARIELQKQGVLSERIELLLRSGIPADEIVRAAKELDADFIMIGSRGNSLKQKIRRLLIRKYITSSSKACLLSCDDCFSPSIETPIRQRLYQTGKEKSLGITPVSCKIEE
jgi:nucleotide-binding universal stress UspA family protein